MNKHKVTTTLCDFGQDLIDICLVFRFSQPGRRQRGVRPRRVGLCHR